MTLNTETGKYEKKYTSVSLTAGNIEYKIVMKFAEDETTGIQLPTISPEGERAEAFPREGLDGVWYDLQGRKLSAKPTQKGLYIVNGKKVVIK